MPEENKAHQEPKQQEDKKKPEAKKQETEAKKQEPKKQEAVERPTNCMKCNKRLQRKTWYYRDRGYYCSKRCWKLAVAAAAKAKAKKES